MLQSSTCGNEGAWCECKHSTDRMQVVNPHYVARGSICQPLAVRSGNVIFPFYKTRSPKIRVSVNYFVFARRSTFSFAAYEIFEEL